MPSLLPGYEYDIFISYRQNDNRSGWVTEFVRLLNEELAATIKESVSVYFDTNLHDGLSDHHDVDLSLGEKVKSLIFIPVLSQTYCDQKSYAWMSEFLPFKRFAAHDSFGVKLKVANGNVASRILPVRIHELGTEDVALLERELDGMIRAIDFTFKASGINRPLALTDEPGSNFNKTVYRDQINKVANAVKEILDAAKSGVGSRLQLKRERPGRISNAVPHPTTSLFGRDKELTEIVELIASNKVTTVVGPGGMGKTRMALELSHRLHDEYDGNIVFAAMAALTAAEQVMPALADTMGIKEAEGRTLVRGISAVIGDTKALIVLDNLEQVIGVAPQVAALISNCPNLKILATSRTPLKISGEYEYALSPLLLPTQPNVKSVTALLEYPSVSLFIDRARKVNSAFTLSGENAAEVVQICKRLDGMPLALELAAARIRMMSPKQLLQKLEHALEVLTSGSKDLPERHQTLRATIDWSYTLLTEPEKALFRRMAVFVGGCSLDGMEQTCYEKDASGAFDALESLVDKALVQHVGATGRFMMLETIKEYALEKLNDASELKTVRMRQAGYFVNIARKIRSGLEGGNQVDAMQMGITEESNLESVLDFLLTEAHGNEGACEIGMTICGELFFFWHIRGKHLIARHFSTSFLNLPTSRANSLSKARCLTAAGLASSTLGQCERSLEEHQAAYTIATIHNDKSTMGFAMLSMFIANLGLGKMEEAGNCVRANLELTKSETDFEIAFAHTGAGILHLVKGEFDAARNEYEFALGMQKKIPDLEGGGLSWGGLAMVSFLLGNLEEAITLYKASLDSFATIGDRAEEARILEEMAWVHLKAKDSGAARSVFLDSIQAYEDVGSVRGIGLALHGIAGVEAAEGRPSKAIEIATAAQLFTEQEGIVNSYGEGFQGKVYLEDAMSRLSKIEHDLAVAAGKKLSLKETLQMAIG